MDRFKVLHFCPGKLGLALPVTVFSKSGIKVGIFDNKENSNDPAKYELLKTKKSYKLYYKDTKTKDLITVDDVFKISDSKDVLEEYVKSDILIITIAGVSEARDNLVKTIKEIVTDREENKKPTYIIACENGHRISSLYRDKMKDGKAFNYTCFCDCIVDRIVTGIDCENADVTVDTESFGLWEIFITTTDKENNPYIIELIDKMNLCYKSHNVEIKLLEDEHYESYFIKKTYCINGIHYALSMIQEYAWQEEFVDDREFLFELFDDPDLKEFTDDTINEIREAAKKEMKYLSNDTLYQTAYEDLDTYINKFLVRLKHNKDTRKRVFNTFHLFDKIYTRLQNDTEGFTPLEILTKLNLNDYEVKFNDRIIKPIKTLRKQKKEQTVNLLDSDYNSAILSLENVVLASSCVLPRVTRKMYDIISMLEESEINKIRRC